MNDVHERLRTTLASLGRFPTGPLTNADLAALQAEQFCTEPQDRPALDELVRAAADLVKRGAGLDGTTPTAPPTLTPTPAWEPPPSPTADALDPDMARMHAQLADAEAQLRQAEAELLQAQSMASSPEERLTADSALADLQRMRGELEEHQRMLASMPPMPEMPEMPPMPPVPPMPGMPPMPPDAFAAMAMQMGAMPPGMMMPGMPSADAELSAELRAIIESGEQAGVDAATILKMIKVRLR